MANFLPSKAYYHLNDRTDYIHARSGYVELLPKRLSLRRKFSAKRFDTRKETLFKEVTVVPFEYAPTFYPGSTGVFNTIPCRYETELELLDALATRLKEVVYETWKPGMAHAVLHSSGLDSRMLSWTIKELHKEHGNEWLGNVLFLCSKWEAESFYGIMNYEGWSKFQWYVPRAMVASDRNYYDVSLLSFDTIWKRHDGPSAIPVNLFWYLVLEAQGYASFPTEDVQLYTGQWGNTVFDAGSGLLAGAGIKRILEKFYYSVLFRRPMKGDEVIHPFTDCKLAKIVASSNVKLGKKLRPKLLNYMDAGLAEFTNMLADGDRHRRIHDDIINVMVKDYDSSWYGKNVMPGERPEWKTTEFQTFWSRWTTASLCEHLLRSGYEIEVIDG